MRDIRNVRKMRGMALHFVIILGTLVSVLSIGTPAVKAAPILIQITDDDINGLRIIQDGVVKVRVGLDLPEVIPPQPGGGMARPFFVDVPKTPGGPIQNGIVFFTEPNALQDPDHAGATISDSLQVIVIPGDPNPNVMATAQVGIVFRSDPNEADVLRGANKIVETGAFQTIGGGDLSLLDENGRVIGCCINLPAGITIQVQSDAVPEPVTVTLFTLGILGLLACGWWYRKSAV